MTSKPSNEFQTGTTVARDPAADSTTIRVQLRVAGTLGKCLPWEKAFEPHEIELEAGSAVSDLIVLLQLPIGKVGIVTINGLAVKKSQVVRDGDLLCLYQPLFGG